MIIDFHAHCFPEKIAAKAIASLEQRSGSPALYNGTAQGLLALMDGSGVDACVVANIATNPRQQRAVNDFALALNQNERIFAFGSVHPEAPDALEELQRLHAGGVRGVKLHPDYQDFFVDEPRVFPIYHELARLGMIVLFHAGVDIGLPSPVHCTPERLRRALPQLMGATVVAAHFGGYLLWREVLEQLCGQALYFDTSYCAGKLPPAWARDIIAAHGAQRLLFGTDLPWSGPQDELNFIKALGLSQVETEAILSGNAAKILAA